MRPFQIVLMAVFGILALAALFLFSNFTGFQGGREAIGDVRIWGTLPADEFERGLSRLQSADRRFSGVRYTQKPVASFSRDLADAIASGTGPDMIVITQEQLLSERAKLNTIPSSSISERVYRDNFLPITEVFLTSSGTYGIPFAIDPLILYYNRTTLQNAGIAEPPRSWEAVAGLALSLTSRADDGTIFRSAIALGEYRNVTNARGIVSLLLLQAGSPISNTTSGGQRAALLATAPGITGATSAESAIAFYTQFADPAKTLYSWNRSMADSRQAFLAGDVAMYLGYASEIPLIKEANPNLDFDIASVPAPQTLSTKVTYATTYAFAIPKASRNASGAYEAAMAMAGSDYAPALANALSMAPALRSALKPPANDLYAPVYYPEALIARGWLSPEPSETDSIFGAMIENVTTGRRGVRDAIQGAEQALNAAYK